MGIHLWAREGEGAVWVARLGNGEMPSGKAQGLLREAAGLGQTSCWDQFSPVLDQPPGISLAFGGKWQAW